MTTERRSKKKEQDYLLTIQEVAEMLRVDQSTVRRWIRQGTLEAVLLPHAGERLVYRIKRSTLDAMLAGKAVEQ